MKWEYLMINLDELIENYSERKGFMAGLNNLGSRGWELCSVEGDHIFYFKRELPQGLNISKNELMQRVFKK